MFLNSVVKRVRRSKRIKLTLLLTPPLAFLVIWFYAPFIITGLYSFDMITRTREIIFAPSLQYYERVLTWGGEITIMLRSLYFGLVTTAISLIVGYPAAYYISFKVKKNKDVLIVLLMIPFWVSFLLRAYALMTLLDERSFVNNVLLFLGLIKQPLQLLYTDLAVIIVMVYNYMLFMILPLYVSLEKLDKSLLEASSTLGAGPLSTFFRVTLPLSMPGILAGSLLVFIPSVGELIIPALVGGPNNFMIGNLIYQIFLGARHWWICSALSVLFIAMILLLAMIYLKKVGGVGLSF